VNCNLRLIFGKEPLELLLLFSRPNSKLHDSLDYAQFKHYLGSFIIWKITTSYWHSKACCWLNH